jgi:hypothetical protein
VISYLPAVRVGIVTYQPLGLSFPLRVSDESVIRVIIPNQLRKKELINQQKKNN